MNTVQDKLEQIKADIASGKLTYPQIRERLEALIEHEYSKEGGPDVDLVIACEDLLWRLGTDNAPFVTHEDEYKEAIRSRIEASQHARQIKKPVLRFVAALAVVALLLGGAEMFLHREWFEQSDTDDEQQHIVQGFSIDSGIIAQSIAAADNFMTLSSTNYQEIKSLLGFDLPEYVPVINWDAKQYFIEIQPSFIRATIHYVNRHVADLAFFLDVKLFSDINNAFASFEEEKTGNYETAGGITVYYSNNLNDKTFMWLDENCMYLLYGFDNYEVGLSIVKSIIGGE